MKAFTFKKTAVAAALLATAASSIAADAKLESLIVAAGKNAPATDFTATTKAIEIAKAGAGAITADTDDQTLAFTVPSAGSIAANSEVTFTFANGGIATATYRLAFRDTNDSNNIKFIPTSLNGIKSEGTSITEISFVVNQLVAADDVVYLVPEAAVTGGDFVADKGIEYIVSGKASSGSKLTASVSVNNPNVADDSIYNAKKDLATALTGLKVNNFGTTSDITTNVNFTKGALEFTTGKVVSEKGFNITSRGYNTALTEAGTDVYPISEADLDKFQADLTLSMTTCDAVKVNDSDVYSVTLRNGATSSSDLTLAKAADKECTWTTADADVHKDAEGGSDDFTLTTLIEVDGETKITDNTVTLGYDLKFTDGAISKKSVQTGSEKASIWSTNVIGGSSLNFPFLTASNGSSSAFSLIKIDNSAEADDTAVLISGVVEQITFEEGKKVSKFLPFSNYKLSLGDTHMIAGNSLGQITGDDVINSLVTPVGEAKFGFNEDALEGLKKDAIHHISVNFQVSSAETPKGSFGKVVAYNSTKTGRIGVAAQN